MGVAVPLRGEPEARKRVASVEEYTELDAASDLRYELHGGEAVCVSGASREHNLIAAYLIHLLISQLEETDCEVYAENAMVRTEGPVPYAYPDVVVCCGGPVYDALRPDTLLNPTVIIEVLSDSTEATDRGAKWKGYRRLESLTDYLLVDQYGPGIEVFHRIGAEAWVYTRYEGLDASLTIGSLGCTLALKDVYKRVKFSGAAASSAEAKEQG